MVHLTHLRLTALTDRRIILCALTERGWMLIARHIVPIKMCQYTYTVIIIFHHSNISSKNTHNLDWDFFSMIYWIEQPLCHQQFWKARLWFGTMRLQKICVFTVFRHFTRLLSDFVSSSFDRTCGLRGPRTQQPTNFLAYCAGLKSSQSPRWVWRACVPGRPPNQTRSCSLAHRQSIPQGTFPLSATGPTLIHQALLKACVH